MARNRRKTNTTTKDAIMLSTTPFNRAVGFRKSLGALFYLVALAATIAITAAGPGKPIDPPCVPLSGTFQFTLLEFGSDGATAHGEGIVKDGDDTIAIFEADYVLDPRGNGVIHTTAHHTITFLDGSGSITTSDEIRLLDGRANSRLYIVDGTGDFEGAIGLLHTHGTIAEGISFKGQVCVP
jgi:hypothetical protein